MLIIKLMKNFLTKKNLNFLVYLFCATISFSAYVTLKNFDDLDFFTVFIMVVGLVNGLIVFFLGITEIFSKLFKFRH